MNIGDKFFCSRCMQEITQDEHEGICPHCDYDPNEIANVRILKEGTLLQGRYQLGAVIGSGGFGITYAAWDNRVGRPVAIKEYFPINLCERDAEENDDVVVSVQQQSLYQLGLVRFIREAKILGTLENVKNVVPVLEWFEANNTAYIVMQYVHGVTLEEFVRDNNIPPLEIISKMRDIIETLILIHKQGVIHRDISPDNIMVQDDGTMTLIDFGAASFEKKMAHGENKTTIYKKLYAPIEQYSSDGMQGTWTDVYALSATLYYLITNENPPESPTRIKHDAIKPFEKFNVKLKKYQKKAILAGLNVQPEKRPQTMEIFHSMLYNLPMPEEVIRRRRFIFRVVATASIISILSILMTINFTYGFYLGNGIRYSLNSDGFHVRGFSYDHDEISFPHKIIGLNVVQIDEGAFQGSEKLLYVSIPKTVKSIGKFAFNGCKNLTTVTFNEGVEKIYSQAFANCSNLQALIIPDSVNEFYNDSFENCGQRLVLLGNLDSAAFELAKKFNVNFAQVETKDNDDNGITLVKYKTLQDNISVPDFINGKAVTAIDAGKDEPVFPINSHSIILPEQLKKIGRYAFYQVQINKIEIPNSLEYIGAMAFAESFIEKISLPDSVNFVDSGAFTTCMSLQTVELSPNMKKIPSGCFDRDSNLKSVVIPEGIEEIGTWTFGRCSSLQEIILPESVKIVNNQAFLDCIALEKIYFPRSIRYINISALEGCPKSLTVIGWVNTIAQKICTQYGFNFYDMSTINWHLAASEKGNLIVDDTIEENDQIKLPAYFMRTTVRRILKATGLKSKKVIVPNTIEFIATGSFRNNKYLEEISFSENLKSIGMIAFAECENLVSVDIKEGLTNIDTAAFLSCKKIAGINLPSTLKNLGEAAFEDCVNITEVTIPSSMVMLNNDVFSGTGITEIKIPGNIVKCGTSFYGCKNLHSAVFDEGIRTLAGTFAECENLEEVIIPSTVTHISRSSFKGCKNLKDVWIYSDVIILDNVLSMSQATHTMYKFTMNNVEKEVLELEDNNNIYLFKDSPNLTIHAHKFSNAHAYADMHSIKFSEIPYENGKNKPEEYQFLTPHYNVSQDIFSEEILLKKITPLESDNIYRTWSRFQYAWGYGYMDIAYRCLNIFEKFGSEDEKLCAKSAKLFLSQSEKYDYSCGQVIMFFEDNMTHPTLKKGDIIVEISGVKLDSPEVVKYGRASGKDTWSLTILRADEKGILQKLEVINSKGYPRNAIMDILPKTFEEQ